jgi:hypothetical protein
MNTEQISTPNDDKSPLSPQIQAMIRHEIKERARREREQARQQAEMERRLKLAFLPVLEWFAENAEQQETAEQAKAALADWEANRLTWQAWGAESGYLRMVDRACMDIHSFKQAMRMLPQTEMERRLNTWVVEAAELIGKRKGITPKKVRNSRRETSKKATYR